MELINSIFDLLDPAKVVPQLDGFLGKLQTIAVIAVLIGPIVMLLTGAYYLIKPPAEANYKSGFRTYFGMGSVRAWRFTQRLAGLGWGVLGAVLTVVSVLVCLFFIGKDPMQMLRTATVVLLIQALLAFICWLAITLVVTFTFDKNGNRRK